LNHGVVGKLQNVLEHKKIYFYLITFISVLSAQVHAATPALWQHEVSISYGNAKEIFYPVRNTGLVASALFHRFNMIGKTLSMSLNADAAYWMADTQENKTMPLIAVDLAARGYFNDP
jgi:hypothetical protein